MCPLVERLQGAKVHDLHAEEDDAIPGVGPIQPDNVVRVGLAEDLQLLNRLLDTVLAGSQRDFLHTHKI